MQFPSYIAVLANLLSWAILSPLQPMHLLKFEKRKGFPGIYGSSDRGMGDEGKGRKSYSRLKVMWAGISAEFWDFRPFWPEL